MNMNDDPSTDQLRTLITPMDDQARHPIVWIDRSGVAQVDTFYVDTGQITFGKKALGRHARQVSNA